MPKSSMKTIKRRIKSVGSTLQITKAMEMVASSKLRRAKHRAEALRPYFEAHADLLTDIAASKTDFATAFTAKREVKNRLFIVIAGDRELAGGFNSNILRLVANYEKENSATPSKIIAIGKRTIDFFKKKEREIIAEYPHFCENIKPGRCADIANAAADMFRSGEVDEVILFYTSYISALRQEPSQIQVLPFDVNKKLRIAGRDISGTQKTSKQEDINYDPSPEAVFDRIIPKMLLSLVSCACIDSFASEQSARRNAMESASDNAAEMIDKLSLQYNRARQEKITNEINEIVGGANAIS
ncbi:MAG: ATP synthase F1 subunit gamma [Oscillospiraceae bacterium]|jgi:F-type H+-transporting ATPase subunit gamma|nr:ATP synthase F1 subunit gamma [Oscillospiraceae bacterium]